MSSDPDPAAAPPRVDAADTTPATAVTKADTVAAVAGTTKADTVAAVAGTTEADTVAAVAGTTKADTIAAVAGTTEADAVAGAAADCPTEKTDVCDGDDDDDVPALYHLGPKTATHLWEIFDSGDAGAGATAVSGGASDKKEWLAFYARLITSLACSALENAGEMGQLTARVKRDAHGNITHIPVHIAGAVKTREDTPPTVRLCGHTMYPSRYAVPVKRKCCDGAAIGRNEGTWYAGAKAAALAASGIPKKRATMFDLDDAPPGTLLHSILGDNSHIRDALRTMPDPASQAAVLVAVGGVFVFVATKAGTFKPHAADAVEGAPASKEGEAQEENNTWIFERTFEKKLRLLELDMRHRTRAEVAISATLAQINRELVGAGEGPVCRGCLHVFPSDHVSLCGRCQMERYCDRVCQKRHWFESHKRTCRSPNDM